MKHTIQFNHKKNKQTKLSKLKAICSLMAEMNLNPKKFLTSFLTNNNENIAFQRQYWCTKSGWDSTLKLLETIHVFVCHKNPGKAQWEKFILNKALKIVTSQKLPSGAYPEGGYHNTKAVTEELFAPESNTQRDHKLVTDHMPFLFGLIYSKLVTQPGTATDPELKDDEDKLNDVNDPIPPTDLDGNGLGLNVEFDVDLPYDHNKLAYMVAKKICSMVAFVKNRRNNGHQLANSLTFLACGVTDRVNIFLNYIGLSSSRKTAHHALNTLSQRSRLRISNKLSKPIAKTLGSFLCFDNLDFKQKTHTKSIGQSSRMFHGTWAMTNASHFDVHSQMLLPTPKEEVKWEYVIKSQIASALLKHLATPSDSCVSINTTPPVVEQICNDTPDITMLKLMIASDNSAQGAGKVCEAIVDQSSKTSMSDFASRVQVIDGDLATCTNLTTLRTQRIPSRHKEESLVNVATIPGGAHKLWNIGIPSKNMGYKKDFTKMIQNIEKIQKASLVHCLMVVMGIKEKHLAEELPKISSARMKEVIDQTYKQFFSIEAKHDAKLHSSPKLSNLILRLSDFATVVKGNSAMKAGDIGQIMNVWKRWAVLAQGTKKLTNYSIQLPRMIILLNEVLPPGLRKVIKHSMFVAPNGKQKHFFAKDHYLENQNYWLKHFFNNTGQGANSRMFILQMSL
ncbi:hypothetical protein PTTG_25447 [Puccinia triticina 1-1 BBBD Race 1]|uniref:DUF6589 domain-containing protein n=1 Tax=Puccinia triticina (isolate 1-1 / race 1 (BBBD)) TaxID=630390 RepID=A0A180H240_PUCT1|nr:hypothetical protein PTTG_25447 [Puccinia triticina 1-1 BBBD Race 1]